MSQLIHDAYTHLLLRQAEPQQEKKQGLPFTLGRVRQALYEQIDRQGLPGAKDEAYRRTPMLRQLANLFESPPTLTSNPPTKAPKAVLDKAFAETKALTLDLAAPGNKPEELPEGLSVYRFFDAKMPVSLQKLLEKHVATSPLQKEDLFVGANTLSFQDGWFIHLSAGTHLKRPLVLNTEGGVASGICFYPRVLVYVEAEASLELIEVQGGGPSELLHQNGVVEMICEEGALVDYAKVQEGLGRCVRLDHTYVSLQARAKLQSFVYTAGGKLTRNNLYVRLEAPEARASLQGLYLCGAQSHIDNHSTIDHQSEKSYSEQNYKGLIGGKGYGVFNGRIFMRPHASKATAYQSNNNLMLGPKARVHAKPQLEIWVDDVRCSHGCTMGQLSEAQRFYLRSRGLPSALADELLLRAFVEEVLGNCPSPFLSQPLRVMLDAHIHNLLST